jgi:DNA-binding LacI/PurR family transcriptional regulator
MNHVVVLDHRPSEMCTTDAYFGFMAGWLEKGQRSRRVDYVRCEADEELAGFESMRQYIDRYSPPAAVYAPCDRLAVGAARALQKVGAVVGRDVAVVGGAGLRLAEDSRHSLTVAQAPVDQLGREAGRMLVEMRTRGLRHLAGRSVPVNLVVKDSFRIPPAILADERRAMARSAAATVVALPVGRGCRVDGRMARDTCPSA